MLYFLYLIYLYFHYFLIHSLWLLLFPIPEPGLYWSFGTPVILTLQILSQTNVWFGWVLMVRYVCVFWASQVALVVKNQSANAGDVRDMDLLPGSRRIHSRRKAWSPLQYSCLENPMVKEAWWAIVRSVAKSWTQLK